MTGNCQRPPRKTKKLPKATHEAAAKNKIEPMPSRWATDTGATVTAMKSATETNATTLMPTIVQPSTPITIRVLPKEVAKLTVTPSPAKVQQGDRTELVVKVARLYDYEGEFKVHLELPKGMQGLTAAPVVIPAGQNEAKLVLHVATAAAPGNRPNLIVRAVATVHGNVALNHDAKINVNITK